MKIFEMNYKTAKYSKIARLRDTKEWANLIPNLYDPAALHFITQIFNTHLRIYIMLASYAVDYQ